MKTVILFVVLFIGLSQCTPPTPQPIDYDQKQLSLMNQIAPQLVGEWRISETRIKLMPANGYAQAQAGITRDTTFQNLATLTIKPAANPRTKPVQPKNPEFEGTIRYKTKTYPIYFYLYSSAERLVSQTGPHAFFMLQYDFPVGIHQTEPEESYLENVGLVGDNFGLYLEEGQPRMSWKGLNRGVTQVTLVKQ